MGVPLVCRMGPRIPCIPLTLVDADFSKRQLESMAREWYMHPNGQLPAYEWSFSDVNPPVHAWAAWRTYKIDAKQRGQADYSFLESIFHKLLLNFTWWANKKDDEGKNVFQGGFLDLDNISVFDRSAPLPTGGHIDQSDGTACMGFYCLVMLKIALELANKNPVYQNSASKFFEHFLPIARAMTGDYRGGLSLWSEEDGFFYDALHLPGGSFKVECPTESGHEMTLGEVATELSLRLVRLFLRNGDDERPIYGGQRLFQDDSHWRDLILFNEYFHGDNGAGLGAAHQTGWTGLVAKLIQQSGKSTNHF